MTGSLDPIERAIADVRAGRAVVVVDDEDRENEGDLIFAASKATPAAAGVHHPAYQRGDLRADGRARPRPAQAAPDDPGQRGATRDRVHRVG